MFFSCGVFGVRWVCSGAAFFSAAGVSFECFIDQIISADSNPFCCQEHRAASLSAIGLSRGVLCPIISRKLSKGAFCHRKWEQKAVHALHDSSKCMSPLSLLLFITSRLSPYADYFCLNKKITGECCLLPPQLETMWSNAVVFSFGLFSPVNIDGKLESWETKRHGKRGVGLAPALLWRETGGGEEGGGGVAVGSENPSSLFSSLRKANVLIHPLCLLLGFTYILGRGGCVCHHRRKIKINSRTTDSVEAEVWTAPMCLHAGIRSERGQHGKRQTFRLNRSNTLCIPEHTRPKCFRYTYLLKHDPRAARGL